MKVPKSVAAFALADCPSATIAQGLDKPSLAKGMNFVMSFDSVIHSDSFGEVIKTQKIDRGTLLRSAVVEFLPAFWK